MDDGHSSSIDFPKTFSPADLTAFYCYFIMVVECHNFRQLQIIPPFFFNNLPSNISLFSLKSSVHAYLCFDAVRAENSSAYGILLDAEICISSPPNVTTTQWLQEEHI